MPGEELSGGSQLILGEVLKKDEEYMAPGQTVLG